MDRTHLERLFEAAVTRTSGTPEELRCAEMFRDECAALGLSAALEPFAVPMATMEEARLIVDGQEIPCRGYLCAGSADVTAPLLYLPSLDRYSLSLCRGKIVLLDGGVTYWRVRDLTEAGVAGIITYNGDARHDNDDIDQKELRSFVSEGRKLPCVNINVKAAIGLVRGGAQTARIVLRQTEWEGQSHNVVMEMPGQIPETIVFSAHYDSTSLSTGAYDNLSGSIGLLGIAEYFTTHPHRHTLRFVWCGSEERGLLGSKAYVRDHEAELERCVLNINLDMIGCIMGSLIACCSTEEKLVSWLEYFGLEQGVPLSVSHDVYSSDSTPFADCGVPAVSLARRSASGTASIHDRYDTMAVMSLDRMQTDIDFLCRLSDRLANAVCCPVERRIPDSIREKLDVYLNRKRKG